MCSTLGTNILEESAAVISPALKDGVIGSSQNGTYLSKYSVIQEESALLWEMIVWVILSKKIHTDMGPSLNGYGVMTA